MNKQSLYEPYGIVACWSSSFSIWDSLDMPVQEERYSLTGTVGLEWFYKQQIIIRLTKFNSSTSRFQRLFGTGIWIELFNF